MRRDSWDNWNDKGDAPQQPRRTGPITQLDVEAEIIRLSGSLEEETEAFEALAKDSAKKEAAYKRAWYTEYLSAEGAQKLRESFAGYKNADLYLEAQVAEALMRAKREKLYSIRAQLDSLRTIAANVRVQVRA